MDHRELAAELFLSDSNCAQAVLEAFGDVTGLEKSLAAKLASSFGGGMGRMREVCGAVSGMLMVAGLLYGYDDPGENDVNKKAHYRLVQTLAGQFREEIGSIICREILSTVQYTTAPTPQHPEGLAMINKFLYNLPRQYALDGAEVLAAKTGFTSQAMNCCASAGTTSGGRSVLCVTANAWTGEFCMHDHAALYTEYCGAASEPAG